MKKNKEIISKEDIEDLIELYEDMNDMRKEIHKDTSRIMKFIGNKHNKVNSEIIKLQKLVKKTLRDPTKKNYYNDGNKADKIIQKINIEFNSLFNLIQKIDEEANDKPDINYIG